MGEKFTGFSQFSSFGDSHAKIQANVQAEKIFLLNWALAVLLPGGRVRPQLREDVEHQGREGQLRPQKVRVGVLPRGRLLLEDDRGVGRGRGRDRGQEHQQLRGRR